MKLVIPLLCFSSLCFAKTADRIWHNGTIITVNDSQPIAQAIAIKNGRILGVGTEGEVMKLKGENTTLVDLAGNTLAPGFVDAHSHVTMVGLQANSANLLPPPDGPNSSIADLQDTLRKYLKTSENPRKLGVLIGFGYDDAQLKEHRHPNREELDQVSKEIPIVIMHQSGHIGVLNTKALQEAGVSAASKEIQGGAIQRKSNSQEPNGVLEENAFFVSFALVYPKLNTKQSIEMLEAGQKLYLKYGFTTIQDGRSSADQVKILIEAGKQGKLVADIVTYPDALSQENLDLLKPPYFHKVDVAPKYLNHVRIGGVKLTLDGSPQGKTAWLTKPYYVPPEGKDKSYVGYGVVSDKKATEIYEMSLRNHWQILTHANGDRAIDQMIATLGAAERKFPGVKVRPVLIHGQTLRKDQIPKLKELGIFPSLFPMHTFYWGDWHRTSVLGPERAENISPTGWVREAGMMFTTHHDAPVALPDSIRVLSATVTRKTRSGYVLGKNQKVDALTALKAMTLWSAYQHFEEKTKGSLEVGKLADFVVLSANPLKVPEDKIIDIKVLETIKEGKTVFKETSTPKISAQTPEVN